jgi:hypothetical protein
MNNQFKLPTEGFDDSHIAFSEARNAAVEANHGLRAKEQYTYHESILRRWSELMINAPVAIHNVLFFIALVVDIVVSWKILECVVRENIASDYEKPAILIISLVLNLWAAITAHLIGKGWSKEIQDWERWNFFFIKNQQNFRNQELDKTMLKERNRARWLAVFSGFVLLSVVGVMIYFRNVVVGGDGSDPASNVLQLVMTVLPLAIIFCEFVTGDYIWYSMRRFQRRLQRNKTRRAFLVHKQKCGELDQYVFSFISRKQIKSNAPEMTGDMEKSFFRAKFRSQDKDDYLDPTEKDKKITFNLHFKESGMPIFGAKVFGTLANGAKTGDYETDELGRVTLHLGDFEKMETIFINGSREIAGPFQSGGEHYLTIPDLSEVLKQTNGTPRDVLV